MSCLQHLFFFCLMLLTAIGVRAAAAAPPAVERDLLTPPLGSDGAFWKVFSEGPEADAAKVWKCSDGILICKGTPKGYLFSAQDYTDFVLRLEWRWPEDKKPGKGGILLRMTGPDKIWPTSLEAQINAGDAGDFWGLDGYPLEGPPDRWKTLKHPQFGQLTNLKKLTTTERPVGQWNQYTITVRGEVVTLEINGQTVNKATGCPARPGKICLTAEGDEIHFRNVRLVPLNR